MSPAVRQALLMLAGGIVLGWVTVALTRRRLITLRYAIGWLAIAVGGILGGLLSPLVKPVSRLLGLSATGLLLAVASCTLLTITVFLSVAVSQLLARVRDLAEAHALLARRLDESVDGRAA